MYLSKFFRYVFSLTFRVVFGVSGVSLISALCIYDEGYHQIEQQIGGTFKKFDEVHDEV